MQDLDHDLPRAPIHSQVIEEWLEKLPDRGCDGEGPDIGRKRAAYRMSSPSSTRPTRTPSPTKRRRIATDDGHGEEGDLPPEGHDVATPRPIRTLPERNRPDLRHTPRTSDKQLDGDWGGRDRDTLSDTSSVSRRSGRGSPTKREAAMRIADDLPLQRVPLKEFLNSPSVGRATASLVRDLSTIRQKMGILPAALRSLIKSQESIDDPLDDTMFTSATGVAGIPAADLEFQHRRLVRICQSSAQCNDPARPVYEAEWNDRVHAPILELALDIDLALEGSSEESLVFHNISDARVASSFRDPSALLKDSMVDYGIFLAPTLTSPLGALITLIMAKSRSFMQFNALENFEIDRPLAIAIETKRTRSGDANAPSQLANFARAQFRVTRYLFSGATVPAGSIIVPLIEVTGSSWRISFAALDADRVLVSSDLAMGSTEQMSDCYVLLRSLLRLLRWLRTECAVWWTTHLQISKTQLIV
ncbi:hypothetical protein F5Y09DRAFT_212093 [Xylaria sp. FL1042]|nr:hypothetical protein F5Y09DRAFT_212093 [Xylaria sp. FL1042]